MLHKEHRWHASTTKSLAFVRAIEAERSGLSQFAKVEYYEMTEGSNPKKPDISSYLSMGSNRTLKNHCVRSKEHQGMRGRSIQTAFMLIYLYWLRPSKLPWCHSNASESSRIKHRVEHNADVFDHSSTAQSPNKSE